MLDSRYHDFPISLSADISLLFRDNLSFLPNSNEFPPQGNYLGYHLINIAQIKLPTKRKLIAGWVWKSWRILIHGDLREKKWPHTCSSRFFFLAGQHHHHHHHDQNASIRAWMRAHKKISAGYWWIFIPHTHTQTANFSKSKLITFFSSLSSSHNNNNRPSIISRGEIKKFNLSIIHWTSEKNHRKLCANLKSNPLIMRYCAFFY